MLPDNWKIGVSEAMGLISLGGSILIAGYVVGVELSGVKADALLIKSDVKANTAKIEQVREEAHKDREEIIDRFDNTDRKMEVIRVESNNGRQWLGEKLDRLIERKLDQ